MDYDLYHDESKVDGYWHGILLVPRENRSYLLDILTEVRKSTEFFAFLSFKDAKEKNVKRLECSRCWIEIGAGALMQRKKITSFPPYGTGKVIYGKDRQRKRECKTFDRIIATKFILFRECDGHKKIDNSFFPDEASKVETTLRMGLKGRLHLLGSEDIPINICSAHFDGNEHYGRGIDRNRLLGRLRGLRSYCIIPDDVPIDDRSSKHEKQSKERQEYPDCQFLQLTDLLIGAFRRLLMEDRIGREKLVAPVNKLVCDWKMGYARMKQSRWFQGYCFSQCYLENGRWNFEDICLEKSESRQSEHEFTH